MSEHQLLGKVSRRRFFAGVAGVLSVSSVTRILSDGLVLDYELDDALCAIG